MQTNQSGFVDEWSQYPDGGTAAAGCQRKFFWEFLGILRCEQIAVGANSREHLEVFDHRMREADALTFENVQQIGLMFQKFFIAEVIKNGMVFAQPAHTLFIFFGVCFLGRMVLSTRTADTYFEWIITSLLDLIGFVDKAEKQDLQNFQTPV